MGPGLGEGVHEQGLGQAPVALVAAHGQPVDVPGGAVVGHEDQRDADDRALGVDDDAQVPRLEARTTGRRGDEVLVGLR